MIYDDDHYVMGGLLAELLAAWSRGQLLTPAPLVSHWTSTPSSRSASSTACAASASDPPRTTLRSIGVDHGGRGGHRRRTSELRHDRWFWGH